MAKIDTSEIRASLAKTPELIDYMNWAEAYGEALLDEIDVLRAKAKRLADVVRAIPPDESEWLCEASVPYWAARRALKSGDTDEG